MRKKIMPQMIYVVREWDDEDYKFITLKDFGRLYAYEDGYVGVYRLESEGVVQVEKTIKIKEE